MALLGLLCLLGTLSVGGCRREQQLCPDTDGGAPVDTVLLAFLSRARAAHHLADRHEADGRIQQAVDALAGLAEGPVPGDADPPVEAREVLADTHARMAELLSRLGHHDPAAEHVTTGLALATEETYFRGHLMEVSGLAEESRAKALRAGGDEAGARQAEQRALRSFNEAMRIQERVIERTVPEP